MWKLGQTPVNFSWKIHALPDEKSYLYFAISNLATIVFAKRYGARERIFRRGLPQGFDQACADYLFDRNQQPRSVSPTPRAHGARNHPSRTHPFSKVCEENNIIHIVAKND